MNLYGVIGMRFIVVSPRQRSGGSIVLHKLCKYLEKQGHEARVFLICRGCFTNKILCGSWLLWVIYNTLNFLAYQICRFTRKLNKNNRGLFEKFFYEPVKGVKYWYGMKAPADVVVIYPEIIYGNPLHGKKIVRWLLYYNRFSENDEAFQEKDLFFCYREIFNDPQLNPEVRKLGLGHFDFSTYAQTNFCDRNGCCYILRKGKKRSDLPQKLNGPVIDNFSEADKVKILNQCKYCYLYDTQTFYAVIAAVCGAIPIIVPEPGKSRKDYLGNDDTSYGVAYGDSDEEIDYAIKTRDLCIQGLKDVESWGEQQVNDFVSVCKEYFDLNV